MGSRKCGGLREAIGAISVDMELALRKDTVLQQDDQRCKLAVQGQIATFGGSALGSLIRAIDALLASRSHFNRR
jgi:hypothetical protein